MWRYEIELYLLLYLLTTKNRFIHLFTITQRVSGLEPDILKSNVLYSAFKRLCTKNISFKETTTFGINEVIGGDGVKSRRLLRRTIFSPLFKEGMTQQAPYSKHRTRVDKVMFSEQGTVTLELLLLRHCD